MELEFVKFEFIMELLIKFINDELSIFSKKKIIC